MANEAAILCTVFLDTSPPQMKMKDSRAEGYWILADRAAACSSLRRLILYWLTNINMEVCVDSVQSALNAEKGGKKCFSCLY